MMTKFPSKFDSRCHECMRQTKKGEVVWGEKGIDGKWRVICHNCYLTGLSNGSITSATPKAEKTPKAEEGSWLDYTHDKSTLDELIGINERVETHSAIDEIVMNAKWRRSL